MSSLNYDSISILINTTTELQQESPWKKLKKCMPSTNFNDQYIYIFLPA